MEVDRHDPEFIVDVALHSPRSLLCPAQIHSARLNLSQGVTNSLNISTHEHIMPAATDHPSRPGHGFPISPFMLLALAILCQSALAWEGRVDANGKQLRWAQHTIPFKLNPSGDHGLSETAINTLVTAATHAWTDPIYGTLTFKHDGRTDQRGASHTDGTNLIYFESDWTHDPSLLAVTYLWSNPDGTIVGFDLAINARDHAWSIDGSAKSNDLLNTLSHEFGHAVGIDHSPNEALATMYASSPPGETLKRDLHRDDIDAVIHLYSGTMKTDEATKGCSTSGNRSGGLAWWALLAACPFIRRRRIHL